jgi:hypothetical protein
MLVKTYLALEESNSLGELSRYGVVLITRYTGSDEGAIMCSNLRHIAVQSTTESSVAIATCCESSRYQGK